MPAELRMMKIIRVELPDGLEGRHIRNGQGPTAEDDHPLFSHLFQRSIDVNRSQAGCVSQIDLGQWKIAGGAIRQPD